jgi:hypothetical protein
MGQYLNMLGESRKSKGLPDREITKPAQAQETIESKPLVPGVLITWLGNDVPAILDCLHREPDGSVWAFVTLLDGWAAINAKFVTVVRPF